VLTRDNELEELLRKWFIINVSLMKFDSTHAALSTFSNGLTLISTYPKFTGFSLCVLFQYHQ